MKKHSFLIKVIVGLAGSAAFILMFNFFPDWVTACMATLIAVLIYYELAFNARFVSFLPVKITGFFVAAAIPWFVYFGLDPVLLYLLIAVSAFAAFLELIFGKKEKMAADITGMLFSESIFQISISLMIPVLRAEQGVSFIIMAFISAWGTDAFAQFGGKCFGKRKLIPSVSPNKTVGGFVSGLVGNALAITVYALVLDYLNPGVVAHAIIVCGVICGAVGAAGDLFFSYIKRTAGIKDFGRFIAGHGGVLDRFDSVIFVLPVWYALVYVLERL